jgi:hypothetical protein
MCYYSVYNIEMFSYYKTTFTILPQYHKWPGSFCGHSGQEDEIKHEHVHHDVIRACATLAAMRMTFTLLRISDQFGMSISWAFVEDCYVLRSDAVQLSRLLELYLHLQQPEFCLLVALFFEPEKEGNKFLRNISSTRLKCVISQQTETCCEKGKWK